MKSKIIPTDSKNKNIVKSDKKDSSVNGKLDKEEEISNGKVDKAESDNEVEEVTRKGTF